MVQVLPGEWSVVEDGEKGEGYHYLKSEEVGLRMCVRNARMCVCIRNRHQKRNHSEKAGAERTTPSVHVLDPAEQASLISGRTKAWHAER